MQRHSNGPDIEQDTIDAVAADWTARLGGGPLSAVERRALDAWLAESPRHAAAFDEAQAAWALMSTLAETEAAPAQPPSRPRVAAWGPMAALAACLLLFIGGSLLWIGDPRPLLLADHLTAPGERRQVTLADGSRVDLGPDSALALEFDTDLRRVRLLKGVAYFTAAPMTDVDPRPFAVAAGGGSARALGTQFMVRHLTGGAEVTVAEHDVQVALDGTVEETVVLSPGQSVRYDHGRLGAVRTARVDRATAWRRGQLVFDHRPLSEVVAALNLYRRGRIVIAGDDLAAREVSGVFDTDDPAAALQTIVANLRIGAASLPPLVTVLY